MAQETIQAEVRLYYQQRQDFDTEYFSATCPTDLYNKAQKIAEERKADHFNCGIATEIDNTPVYTRRPRISAAPSSVKDQVKFIEERLGKMED